MTDAQGDTFISHLIELRSRLIKSIVAVLIVFLCFFPFASTLYALLAKPMLAVLPAGGQMIATEVTTPFFVPMKVALMAAFLVALPYVLYQMWAFVAPGLYAHEKRMVLPLIVMPAARSLSSVCRMIPSVGRSSKSTAAVAGLYGPIRQ